MSASVSKMSAMHNPVFILDFIGTAVITDEGRTVSYAELKNLSDKWAVKVAPRSLVFLLVGNNLDSLVAYVACLNHGIVPLMLDAHIDGQLLQRFMDIYRPDFLWRPADGGYILEQLNTRNTRNVRMWLLFLDSPVDRFHALQNVIPNKATESELLIFCTFRVFRGF